MADGIALGIGAPAKQYRLRYGARLARKCGKPGDSEADATPRKARNHPLNWQIPTSILYGEKDNLTSIETIRAFAEKQGASLTVMKGGEHWFHTEEEMKFLDEWSRRQK